MVSNISLEVSPSYNYAVRFDRDLFHAIEDFL